MPAIVSIGSHPTAQAKFSSRGAVVSPMGSSEWGSVPASLRQRAFFSSRLTDAKAITAMRDLIASELSSERGTDGVFANRGAFVAKIKDLLESRGYPMGGTGLTDLTSNRRLSLIHRMAVEDAYGYARHASGQDADLLDAFPAQELFRAEDRRQPRDWESRWTGAGGRLFGGRMIALKGDPVWTAISRFGTPWPPFDYNSGMDVRDVDRQEAEALGLIEPGEDVIPESSMPELFEAKNIDDDLLKSLTASFPAAVVSDGKIAYGLAKDDWKARGYGSSKEWGASIDNTPLRIPATEAEALLNKGEHIRDVFDKDVLFSSRTIHWMAERGTTAAKKNSDIEARLERYPLAKEAVRSPREVWQQEGQITYLATYPREGKKVGGIAVVVKDNGAVHTYFSKHANELNKLRHGVRIKK